MKELQKLWSQAQVKLKNSLIILISLLILVVSSGCSIYPIVKDIFKEPEFERSLVTKVIDGDTIELEDGRRVRYLGINTPELGEFYGKEATNKNQELVEGKIVELQKGNRDTDEYGRFLRYVYIDGIFVNAELVSQGYAEAYIFDANERYSQVLVQLEQYAKLKRRGMWADNKE